MTSAAPPAAPTGQQWPFVQGTDLVGGFGDSDSLTSSDNEELPDVEINENSPTEESVQELAEQNKKLQMMVQRVEQRKKKYQNMLKAYQRKEMEFVGQMDAHMDEVEQNENTLTLKIEQLSAENCQLRSFNEKRERDNSQLAERLSDTTKQCSESETRVQFLVDRIVALLSNGAADQAQTDAVLNMRQRERDMLRQLEETRQQFDEVRQQNGELHSRLTEELSLSRRLQDQLVEVEERFSHFQQYRGSETSGGSGVDNALQTGVGPSSSGFGDSLPMRGPGRLGPRTMGLRSDQTEAPREIVERPPLPELPPPISEIGEALVEPPGHTLDPLLESELPGGVDCEMGAQQGGSEIGEPGDDMDSEAARMQSGARPVPTVWPENSPANARTILKRMSGLEKSSSMDRPAVASYSRTSSSEGVLLMEQRLREALDGASFECAVVRVESGIYDFGPSVRAVVKLTAEGEVVACQGEGPWVPIDDFIRDIAQSRQLQEAPAAASDAGATGRERATPMEVDASGQTPGRRVAAPAAAPRLGTMPQAMGMTAISSIPAQSVTQSTSPPRMPPQAAIPLSQGPVLHKVRAVSPSGNEGSIETSASNVPSMVTAPMLGRQSAGSTPERLRMPGQPPPGTLGSTPAMGQMLASGPMAQQAVGAQRMLIPNLAAPMRYSAAVSPARQMPTPTNLTPGGPYAQTITSPRC